MRPTGYGSRRNEMSFRNEMRPIGLGQAEIKCHAEMKWEQLDIGHAKIKETNWIWVISNENRPTGYRSRRNETSCKNGMRPTRYKSCKNKRNQLDMGMKCQAGMKWG